MKIIIIGGEAAGMSAAAKARRMIRDAEIIVYEASDVISFGACGLPYFVGDEFQDPDYMAEFTPEQFATKGIQVKINHRVTRVEPENKTIEVKNGDTVFTERYDRLMIATGARESMPPIPGLELRGVFGLRRMEDGLALKATVAKPECKKVVVIGSGFIGLEIAEAMVHQGKEVRLIERAERVIPDAFDAEISQYLDAELRAKGVQVHLSERVDEIVGIGKVSSVRTGSGEYPADLVVVCTGVKPNTDFVKDIGLEMLPNGAIRVDRCGRTSLADIYSAGDCATVWHLLKQSDVYVPLATVANKLGRVVGENLAGVHTEFAGILGAAAVKVLDLEAGRTGLSESEAQSLGLNYRTVVIKDKNHTNYCANQADIHVKLIYEADSKKILGGQILGKDGAVHRLHALSVAIVAGLTTEQLGMIDFAYAPPFARPWDVLNVAGNVAK